MGIAITIIVIVIIAGVLLTFNDRAKNKIICQNQNCGFRGVGKASGGKDIGIFLILCLFGIIPGIIYIIWPSPKKLVCPNCGMQVR